MSSSRSAAAKAFFAGLTIGLGSVSVHFGPNTFRGVEWGNRLPRLTALRDVERSGWANVAEITALPVVGPRRYHFSAALEPTFRSVSSAASPACRRRLQRARDTEGL